MLISGTMDVSMLGADSWPTAVNAQMHSARGEPFRDQAGIDAVIAQVRAAGGEVEIFDYDGAGHLFTDASLLQSTTSAGPPCRGRGCLRSAKQTVIGSPLPARRRMLATIRRSR